MGVADPATAEGQVAPFIFETEIQGPTFDNVLLGFVLCFLIPLYFFINCPSPLFCYSV